MHTLLVCAYNSQDLAQNQENFARSHNPETVTFRNSRTASLNIHKSFTKPSMAKKLNVIVCVQTVQTDPGNLYGILGASYIPSIQ